MNNRNRETISLDDKLRLLLKEIGLEEPELNEGEQPALDKTIKHATSQIVNKSVNVATKTANDAINNATKNVNDAVNESVRKMFATPKTDTKKPVTKEMLDSQNYQEVKDSFAKPKGMDEVFLDSQMRPNTIDTTFQNAREYTGTFIKKLKNFATGLILLIIVSSALYLFNAQDYALVPVSLLLLGNLFLTWPMNLKLILPLSIYFGLFGFANVFTGVLASLGILSGTFLNIGIIGGMALLVGYYWIIIKQGQVKKERIIKHGSLSASDFKGMDISDNDAKFIADELNKVEISINNWEANIKQSPKLRKIEEETKGLQAAKALFALLVKMPKQTNNAGEFVYRHIPNVEALSNTYIEVANHSFKNDETLQTLYDSEGLMRKLSKQIVQDYSNLVSSDLYKLEIEMNMAKKNLNK